MAVDLEKTWNGESLEEVRKFIQQKLGGSVKDMNIQTLNGRVVVTLTTHDGSTIEKSFLAAEGSDDEGYRCDLSIRRRQAVYSAGSTVSFNYTFTQTLYGEENFSIIPTIEFTVWTVDAQNSKRDQLYSTTTNAIGTHLIEIPASVFAGVSGNILIEGTYRVNYDGNEYRNTKSTMISIAQCHIEFDNFKLSTQIKGYNETNGMLQNVLVRYNGTYEAELQMYIDGVLRSTLPLSIGGSTSVQYAMNTTDQGGGQVLSTGRHTIQLVAKMDTGVTDDRGEELYIYSNSLLFDFYKGLAGNHVGIQADFDSSEIINDVENGVTINTEQYVNTSIKYAGCSYDVGDQTYQEKMAIAVYRDNEIVSNLSVAPDEEQEYTFRDTESGSYSLLFSTSTNNRKINIVVNRNSSGVGVAPDALIDINVQGRSNAEQSTTIDKLPFRDSTGAQYEGILTNFQHKETEGGAVVDGWDGESLVFRGNTQLDIPYFPFDKFSMQNGMYIEFNFMVETILNSDINIIDCLNAQGKGGFYLKAEEAGIITAVGDTKVFTPFKTGEWYTVGFMVSSYQGKSWTNSDGSSEDHTRETTTLLELYVNGIRTGTEKLESGDSFDRGVKISMNGLGAIWKFTNMRVYNRSIRPLDIFNNWLTNFTDANDIIKKSNENNILNTSNTDVSSTKLISLGKNVMIVEVGDGVGDTASLDSDGLGKLEPTGTPSETQVLSTRAAFLDPKALKKQNYLVKGITYYNKGSLNDPYSFKVGPTLMQCQGTSSTYYSRKNYDIFFCGQKYSKSSTNPSKNNWVSEFDDSVGDPEFRYNSGKTNPRYKMGANDKPVPVICMKADYVDSSNLHNTCICRLLNDAWKAMGNNFKTPPQYNNDTDYPDVRVAINGHPVDIFVKDRDGETYIGQYNMDNEKKDSHDVFGFTPGSGNPSIGAAVCIEFLENNKPATLFKASSAEGFNWDTCSSSQSSDGTAIPELEFRYPSNDWVDGQQQDKNMVKELFEWVYDCWKAWKGSYQEETGEYTNNQFISELKDHFNVHNLCAWYLYTEYFLAVDQRSKNMMLATWDRQHWYFLPYDSDTALGVTNDGYLIIPYNADENTKNPMDDNQYAYMGHDSALWELVRHFLFDDTYTKDPKYGLQGCNLSEVAAILREENEVNNLFNMANVLRYFNEARDYWSEMSYNFDEDTKYIAPLTLQSAQGTKTAFAQFVQGARDAHRTWLLDKRFRMLDAKYGCGYYTKDIVNPYLSVADSNISFSFKVVTFNDTTIRCYKNGVQPSNMIANVRCKAGEETIINIRNQSFGSNDPFVIVGISSVKEIDFQTAAPYLLKGLKLYGDVDCARLEKFTMEAPNGNGAYNESLTPIVSGLIGVKDLTIKGYPSVTGILDLSNNLMLENVDINCERLSSVIMPYSLVNIKTFNLGKLNENVPWEFWDELNTLHNRRTGGSIVVCEFTVDNPNYGFKNSRQDNSFIMSTGKYSVMYLNVPSLVPNVEGSSYGLFGSNTTLTYRDPSLIKKVYYAKVDTRLFTNDYYAQPRLYRTFQNCTNLEYVNTRGWYYGKYTNSITHNTANLISFILPPNANFFDLSWIDVYENAITYNKSDNNLYNELFGYSTVIEYVRFSDSWFNAIRGNKINNGILIPKQSTLTKQHFIDMETVMPDVTDIQSTVLRTLNFGTDNYNDHDRFPDDVRRRMEAKGWILAT